MQKYLIGIVVIGIAFSAGYFTQDLSQEPRLPAESSSLALTQKNHTLFAPSTHAGDDEEPRQNSPVASSSNVKQAMSELSLDELTKRIGQINAMGIRSMSFSDTAALYSMIDSLEQDELLRMMDEFAGDPSLTDSTALFVLLSKYAELSPKGALAYAQNNIAAEKLKDSAVLIVMTAFAKTNPIGALAEYQQIMRSSSNTGAGNIINGSLVSIFSVLAETDKTLAIDKLMEIELSGHSMTMALFGLTTQLSGKQDYLDVFRQIGNAENHTELTTSLISSWALQNPKQAAKWLENDYSGDQYNSIRETLYSSWSVKEPEKSADWMLNSASETNLKSSVRRIISSWSMRDPESALAWMTKQSSKVYNQSTLKSLLDNATYSNPTFVDQHLTMITSEEERKDLASQVYQSLKRQSDKKAQAYLEQSPYKEGIKEFDAKLKEILERG